MEHAYANLNASTFGLHFNAFFHTSYPMPLRSYFYANLGQPTLTGTLGFSYVPTILMISLMWVYAFFVTFLDACIPTDSKNERVFSKTLPSRSFC